MRQAGGVSRRGGGVLQFLEVEGASAAAAVLEEEDVGRGKASPAPESLVLHVDQLSRNVNENHLKEIFGNFGEVVHVRLAMDHVVNLPKGFAYVEFKIRADAEKAQLYMDGAQIDGKVVRAKFTLPERKKVASPPKTVATTSRRDASKAEDTAADGDRDGEKHPRDGDLLDQEEDLLDHEGDLLDEVKILHPHLAVELILLTAEVTPLQLGEGLHYLLPEAVHLLLRGASGHRQGHLQEEYVVVLFVGDLLLHLGGDSEFNNLAHGLQFVSLPYWAIYYNRNSLQFLSIGIVHQDVSEVLQEDLLLVADVVALLLGGLLVRHHDHPLLEEVECRLLDVGGPILHRLVHHAGSGPRRVSRSRSPRRPIRGRNNSSSSSTSTSSSPPPKP
ncbi:hypothetical protein SASPL_132769 [Salvia splendens]|uniref:RRM domain-containing protein n=1 Tax=Salvia splendens TaxID=180675 RepID=A0A8X8X3T8_SALSN|nr:hypothetical protein SASPL_132769 [Salvia splendens]